MPYIKRIASSVAKADNGGGGNKKAGLVYGSDWARIPRMILLTKAPKPVSRSCMLSNCKRVKNNDGTITEVPMAFTTTYIRKTARNNTLK